MTKLERLFFDGRVSPLLLRLWCPIDGHKMVKMWYKNRNEGAFFSIIFLFCTAFFVFKYITTSTIFWHNGDFGTSSISLLELGLICIPYAMFGFSGLFVFKMLLRNLHYKTDPFEDVSKFPDTKFFDACDRLAEILEISTAGYASKEWIRQAVDTHLVRIGRHVVDEEKSGVRDSETLEENRKKMREDHSFLVDNFPAVVDGTFNRYYQIAEEKWAEENSPT